MESILCKYIFTIARRYYHLINIPNTFIYCVLLIKLLYGVRTKNRNEIPPLVPLSLSNIFQCRIQTDGIPNTLWYSSIVHTSSLLSYEKTVM